jgi:hypothetical protein
MMVEEEGIDYEIYEVRWLMIDEGVCTIRCMM